MAIRDIDTAFRVANNNGTFTVTLGDLFAEEKKDLLVKLQVKLGTITQLRPQLWHCMALVSLLASCAVLCLQAVLRC